MFQSARRITSMSTISKYYDNLECGNAKRLGCKVHKRLKELYYCPICEMLKAKGQDFFDLEGTLTPNEMTKMTKQQKDEYKHLRVYWDNWLKTYGKDAP